MRRYEQLLTGIFAGLAAVTLLSGVYVDGQAAGKAEEGPKLLEVQILREEAVPVREYYGQEEPSLRQPLTAKLKQVLELEKSMEEKLSVQEQARVQALYEEQLTEAITGGYDRELGTVNSYAKEDGRYLDQRMADYYRDFVSANGDSRTAVVLEKYLQVLEENDFCIDTQVLDFYETTPELVQQWSRLGPEDFQYWLWKLGLLDWFA